MKNKKNISKKKKLNIQEEMKEMFLRDFINALKKSNQTGSFELLQIVQ